MRKKVVTLVTFVIIIVVGVLSTFKVKELKNKKKITEYQNNALKIMNVKSSESNIDISERIPEEAISYANDVKKNLLEDICENQYFDCLKNDEYSECTLGRPFFIYDSCVLGDQDEIYYFPVIKESKTIAMLYVCASKNDEEKYSAGITGQFNNVLEKLEKENDFIVYNDTEKLYLQDETGMDVLCEFEKYSEETEEYIEIKQVEKTFKKLSYNEKCEAINNTYLEDNNIAVNESSGKQSNLIEAKGFTTKTSTTITLNTDGCLVSQHDLPICWAASTALIARYVYPNSYGNYTAEMVCKRMNMPYEGAIISQIKTALNSFGLNYKIAGGQVSFSKLIENLSSQRPLMLIGYKNDKDNTEYRHAVSIVGSYNNGVQLFTYFNSGDSTFSTVQYSNYGTTLSFYNETYKWENTLCAK